MAVVLYFLDAATHLFRSAGGPDIEPAFSTSSGGYGQIAYGLDPYGSPQ